MRTDGRQTNQLRPIKLTTYYQKGPYGSVLIQWGNTWVICAASVEEKLPPFRHESQGGWLTGEYNMLPSSTAPRKERKQGGREKEIQRLIGRGLRAAFDLKALGPRTLTVDCDVIQADGGTRVAALTGGFVATALAVRRLINEGLLKKDPIIFPVAATSVGILENELLLDLAYDEDSRVAVDMNIVMNAAGNLVEIQGTAEGTPFERKQLDNLIDLAWGGIKQICTLQKRAIEESKSGQVIVTL